MRRKTVLWFLLSALLIVLTGSGSVFAAGFALYEGGARGLVLGAGLTATADDASAVFYNPAGITQLKGIQTMIGATAIGPKTEVKTAGNITFKPMTQEWMIAGTDKESTDFETNWFFPPHAYFTQQLSDRFWVGAGVFSRFGLGTEYPSTWPGRYNSYDASITTLEFNPNIAWKISETFSIAGGLNVTWFDLTLKKKTPFNYLLGIADVDVNLSGDAWGWGLNLAAHYKPCDWFSAGLAYRSRVSIHVEGDVDFKKPALPDLSGLGPYGPPVAAGYAASFNDTGAGGNVMLPDEIFAGLAFKPLQKLTVGGGVYWTRWSTYDALEIRFDDPVSATGIKKTTSKKDWDDTFRYMIGVEWNATDWMDLRLGYAYDESPVPDKTIDYLLPDNDRHQYAIGLGFHKDRWLFDVSYMYLKIKDRDIDARPEDGVLDSQVRGGFAHLIAMSFGYKF